MAFSMPVGVSETRCGALPRRGCQVVPLRHDGAGIAVGEALDPGVFLAEADAAGQQYQGEAKSRPQKSSASEAVGCHAARLFAVAAFVFASSPMFNILLYEPEIPPNTGNVIRLCANTGCTLHLVEPLGFELTDRRLRRAGLDYHDMAEVRVHAGPGGLPRGLAPARCSSSRPAAPAVTASCALSRPATRCCSARRRAACRQRCCAAAHAGACERVRIPMRPGNRSLNLSNAVALVVYEAWRQHGFAGASAQPPDQSNSGLTGRSISPRTTWSTGWPPYSTP